MRTVPSRALDLREERALWSSRRRSDACKPSAAVSPAVNGKLNSSAGACESCEDGRPEKGAQNSLDEITTPRRFTCHEINYKTDTRKKENNEARKSVCCQRSVGMSTTARRNSRNVSSNSTHEGSSSSGDACDGKSTEIYSSSQAENQGDFTEIELVEYSPERKDTPMTTNSVSCLTTESLKNSLKMIIESTSDSEFRTIPNYSIDPIPSNDILGNRQPRLTGPQVRPQEPSGSPSRDASCSSSPPQGCQTSNSSGRGAVGASGQRANRPSRAVPNAGKNNSEKNVNFPRVRLPHTLQDTIVKFLVRRLGVAVWNWREDNPQAIEAFVSSYRSVVPAHVRSLMLACVQQEGRVWHTVTLRLLQLLLGEDCSTGVRVQQVRVFFRDQFLACLPPLSRLTVLRVEDPTWRPKPQQEALLCTALPRLQQLRVLSLHYLATDAVVAAAVDNCPHLQVLDVFFSSAVTNRGAYWLLGRRDVGSQVIRSPSRQQRRKRWYASAVSWISRVRSSRKKSRRETRPVLLGGRQSCKSQEQLRVRPGRGNSTQMSSNSRVQLKCSTRASPSSSLAPDTASSAGTHALVSAKLLPHLRVLDLRGTAVSGAAILEVMEARPEVKVLTITSGSD